VKKIGIIKLLGNGVRKGLRCRSDGWDWNLPWEKKARVQKTIRILHKNTWLWIPY